MQLQASVAVQKALQIQQLRSQCVRYAYPAELLCNHILAPNLEHEGCIRGAYEAVTCAGVANLTLACVSLLASALRASYSSVRPAVSYACTNVTEGDARKT